jgi:hypothetical protein
MKLTNKAKKFIEENIKSAFVPESANTNPNIMSTQRQQT